jgi:coenzyme F420-dependent glucose-6-phosphate dehydrogenase
VTAPVLGYHCSHEQWPPSVLLDHLSRAEAAGFRAAMCSDHFHPWIPANGHGGHSWTWLAAALERTKASGMTLGTVNAPGQRYHPGVVAQAFSTLGEMYPGRIWVALGTGEAVNESITGESWPPKETRKERLRECAAVLRRLWDGERVDHEGLVRVRGARLYSRPGAAIPLFAAALTAETARWAGTWAEGLITAGSDAKALRGVVEAFREGGGLGRPVWLQLAVSYAPSLPEARRGARERWPQAVLPGPKLADLDSPEAFAAAVAEATEEDVARLVPPLADPRALHDAVAATAEAGFARIYLHNVAPHPELFLDACARELPLARVTEG